MPQIPIIIPVIVAGLVVGSVLTSKGRKISGRKLFSASLVAGLLNAAYAYLLYFLEPPQTFTTQAAQAFAAQRTSELPFVGASFLTGFLMVLAILGIAALYARFRKGAAEELGELASEEESTLKLG